MCILSLWSVKVCLYRLDSRRHNINNNLCYRIVLSSDLKLLFKFLSNALKYLTQCSKFSFKLKETLFELLTLLLEWLIRTCNKLISSCNLLVEFPKQSIMSDISKDLVTTIIYWRIYRTTKIKFSWPDWCQWKVSFHLGDALKFLVWFALLNLYALRTVL